MKVSSIGWLILAGIAAVWEAVGLAGFGGVTPLTWDVWHLENSWPTTGAFVAAALAWLAYHFLIQKRRKV